MDILETSAKVATIPYGACNWVCVCMGMYVCVGVGGGGRLWGCCVLWKSQLLDLVFLVLLR